MSECVRCERPVQDAHVCTKCGRDLERALGNIPAYAVELDLTISKQTRFTPQSDVPGGGDPLVVDLRASEVTGTLKAILVGWTRMYLEETHVEHLSEGPTHKDCLHLSCSKLRMERTPWPKDNLTDISRFLLGRVEWFRHHEAAGECVDEILEAVHEAWKVIDTPANRTSFVVGPCPEVDAIATPCEGEIKAFVPTGESASAWMSCTVCEARYDTTQWHRAGRRIIARADTLRELDVSA